MLFFYKHFNFSYTNSLKLLQPLSDLLFCLWIDFYLAKYIFLSTHTSPVESAKKKSIPQACDTHSSNRRLYAHSNEQFNFFLNMYFFLIDQMFYICFIFIGKNCNRGSFGCQDFFFIFYWHSHLIFPDLLFAYQLLLINSLPS